MGSGDRRAPSTAVVVVSHQTRAHALACLDTLADAGADEVVVVDTGSNDGTVEAVCAAHPEVRVLAVANVGFGRGANLGVAATGAPVVVVANADVRFAPDSVRELARCLADAPDVAAVGPQVRYPDGRPQASARRLPSIGTAVGHAVLARLWPGNPWTRRYRATDRDPQQPRDVDWLSGCALGLRRAAFDAIGGFDPAYFLYVEDVDLGVRLRRAGWRLRYEPSASVVHGVGASTSRRRRTWSLVTHARSLDRFYGRHLATTRPRRLARPLVRAGLVGWVVATLVLERLLGRGRSTTGE
ncbi:glycosyltransferase family 2 protein [Egicoccus halophilus]|uniref:Putative dTDP-rhamnosyltransferase n=1 Tax=Egicoccus halophilus TaxID=1670830 RepID=A0A8J3EWL0_9ACTN|nr:glycosyltransferase family 2 protein [Egicoccus halophilus]GGI03892.1 putative dTDP-rhamnosyltransferase [Egicoccus halophilus]